MINCYALKNTKVPFWNPPTFSPAPKEAVKQGLFRQILLDPNESKKNHLDECELYFLGTYDDVSGKFDLLDDPEFLLDLKGVFPNAQS